MAEENDCDTERALWASVIVLEDAAGIAERVAMEIGPEGAADAQRKRKAVAVIKALLNKEPGQE
jgi:hypothetical protein